MRKYEFTGETKVYEGRTLNRIRRIEDGLIGGWIETEKNLSHSGGCFVYDESMVYDNGKVYGYGRVFDNGKVFGNGKVFDNGEVYDNGIVFGNGILCGDGEVYGNGIVYGNGKVFKGKIIGEVSLPYKNIFQYQCEKRVLTAILTEDDEILYSIGYQSNITKEVFLDRIHNENGGLEENPHREEYLRLIPAIEMYFGK